MGYLSIPQAISLFSGLPLETCERASKIAEQYAEDYPPNTGNEDSRRWYRRKWDRLGAAIGTEATFTYAHHEALACFGEEYETYCDIYGWLEQWRGIEKATG